MCNSLVKFKFLCDFSYSVVDYVVDEGALAHIRNSNHGYVQRSLLQLRVVVYFVGHLSKCWRGRCFSLFTIYLCITR